MRRTTLLTAALAIAGIIATTTPAFANRDPGMGGMPMYNYGPTPPRPGGMPIYNYGSQLPVPPRIGQNGLNNQYADGMNLYQYVRSSPINRVDPSGLFGRETHFGQVKDSMHRRCPAIEDAVAAASQGMDEGFHDAPSIIIFGWLTLGLNTLRPEVQQDYDYHFPGGWTAFPGSTERSPKGMVQSHGYGAIQASYRQE